MRKNTMVSLLFAVALVCTGSQTFVCPVTIASALILVKILAGTERFLRNTAPSILAERHGYVACTCGVASPVTGPRCLRSSW